MTKVPGKFRQASISDIHLGHPNTPTTEVIQSLKRAFPDNEETGKLDIIWFGGDLFDRAMSLDDPNVTEIKVWAFQFLRMCAKRDIVVRLLEGTPSHDWKQSRLLHTLNEQSRLGVDLKFVETLSIERIERFGIDVLYVPDEWLSGDTEATRMAVVELLREHGLQQVDYAIMHGVFPHQLPSHVKIPMHDPEFYLSITRHYVYIGHVHLSSRYERILANGSIERLSHGEEGPKGHWRITVDPEHGDEVVFVENKKAKIYKSVNCAGLPVEDALKRLEIVATLPPDSHARVVANKSDPILTNMDVLRKLYPFIHWTSKSLDAAKSETQANMLKDMRSSFVQINITRDNIRDLILQRLRHMTTDERVLSRCAQRLSEIIK